MVNDSPNEYLTLTQFAELAGVGRKTAHAWALSRRIPSTRTPGGHYRIRRAVLDQMPVQAAEFAEMVGVTKRTVVRWCSLGLIKAWRDQTADHQPRQNGAWLIPRDEVNRALEQMQTGAYRPGADTRTAAGTN